MATLYDNYPDGTWSGDPNAPWNQDEPPVCCDKLRYTKAEELDGTWNNCPWCGEPIDWYRWDDVNEEWR